MLSTGYKSKYRRTKWQKLKSWALAPANTAEQILGLTCIIFGAFIGLELAIVSIFNVIYWGL